MKLYLPLLKDIFTAADEKEALRRKEHLVLKLEEKYPKVAVWVDEKTHVTIFSALAFKYSLIGFCYRISSDNSA